MIKCFGSEVKNIVFACIPASSAAKNEIRYKEFAAMVCRLTGAINAYDHIHVEGERLAVHEKFDQKKLQLVQVIEFDKEFFKAIFVNHFMTKYADCHQEVMVVSPDVGSVARARAFAQKLDMPLAIVDKRRQKANSSEVMNIIGDVRDKRVILLDDMVDTGGSLCGAAKALVEVGGAKSVTACASHGVLSGPAIQRIEDIL